MSACVFRLCGANVIMVVEQATPGDDESTLQRYPIHHIGGNESFGRCPASLLAVPLTPYLYDMLEEAAKFIEVANEVAARAAKPISRTPKPDAKPYWFNGSLGGPYAGKGIGATNDAIKMDFVPTPTSPAAPTGVPMSDNSMRDQLRNLTLLTCKTLGEAQEICAQITQHAEQIDAMMASLKEKQVAAANLAHAAVGDGEAPEAAKRMVEGAVMTKSTVDDADAALQLLLVRVAAAAVGDLAAATNGITYMGQL